MQRRDQSARDFSEGGGLFRPFAEEQRQFFSAIGITGWLIVGGAIIAGLCIFLYAMIWAIK